MIELVSITEKHRESLVRILKNHNVEKWLINVPSGYTEKDADSFIEFCRKNLNNPDAYNFAIELSGVHIGGIGIRRQDKQTGVIGYYIDESFWRKGYASMAIHKILEIAREKLNVKKVEADTLEGNEASELLLKKCGFRLKGQSHIYSKNGKQFNSKRYTIELDNQTNNK